MLVRFTVDPEVFIGSVTGIDCRDRHERLIELWETCGILVLPGPKESESRMVGLIRNAPVSVQKRWELALKTFRKSISTSTSESLLSSLEEPTSRDLSKLDIQVISLDPTKAELWGVTSDDFSREIKVGTEICRFGHERRTKVFSNAIESRDDPIVIGTTFSEFWNRRLIDYAANSRVIVISDRYIGSLAAQRDPPVLVELVAKVACLPHHMRRVIEIYTSIDETNMSPAELALRLRRMFEKLARNIPLESGLREIRCYVTDGQFGRIEHYRSILFDQKDLVLIDKGLSAINPVSRQTCPVQTLSWLGDKAEPYRKDFRKMREIVEAECCVNIGCRSPS